MQKTQVQSLGQEDSLEVETAIHHSSILAWKIPRTEEPVGLQSMRSQSVRHELVTKDPCIPSLISIASPIITTPLSVYSTFVTSDEPTLTCHDTHPESILYIRIYSWYVHSMDLDKCIVTCISPYHVKSTFTALRILCALPVHPCLVSLLATTHPFTVSIVLPSALESHSM